MLEEMKMATIDTIITENRTLLRRMRDLNRRAGRDVFPIPNLEGLKRYFASALQGARRVHEIIDWDALRLPPLDQSTVNNILAGCPDTIMVLGTAVKVEYEDEYGGTRRDPRVKLPLALVSDRAWLDLPDEGVTLPNGRRVAVAFSPSSYSGLITDTSIPALKERARESLNRGMWVQWSKPELPMPVDAIAPIEERQYGRCVVTDVPLIAFGTVRRSWSSWYTHWTRDRAEAEQVRDESCRRFIEMQEETRRAELTKHLGELYKQYRDTAPEALRNRMYHAVCGYDRLSADKIEAIIAEVEATLKPKTEPNLGKVDMSQMFGGTARVR